MNTSTRLREISAQLCAEPRAEDGIDPRSEKRGRKPRCLGHQNERICREAEKVLSLMLANEAANPLLRDLRIVSVDLLDHGRNLHVVLLGADSADFDADVETALKQAQPWLRSELARSFHRKRMPSLTLEYVSGASGGIAPCR
ncbi:MAG: hypothetical protein ACU84J_16190 [Gammaproteobacteria bacterium]